MGEFHNLLTLPKTGWAVSMRLYTVLVPRLVNPVPELALVLPTLALLSPSTLDRSASPSLKANYVEVLANSLYP